MSAFAYLSGMTSIILALSITRIFTGIGTTLEKQKNIHVYWPHLIWTLNLFLFISLEWWILFRWQDFEGWNFFLFLFLLLSPAASFLLAVLLFPGTIQDTDYKQHFFKNRRWFFAAAALLPPLDAADTLLKGFTHFQNQGVIYPIFLSMVFTMTVIGAIWKNETYHKIFAVFFLIYILGFILINLNTL